MYLISFTDLYRSTTSYLFLFFFNDTATTEIYTLSLHDALPILLERSSRPGGLEGVTIEWSSQWAVTVVLASRGYPDTAHRSEEHTSELQSRQYLVCRLLLEKKKKD